MKTPLMETAGDMHVQVMPEQLLQNAPDSGFVVTETLGKGFVVMEAVPGAGCSGRGGRGLPLCERSYNSFP